MNKTELVAQVAKRANLPLTTSRKAVQALCDSISDALKDGDRVQLVGFGTFKVTARAAREGRNPQTGKTMHIPASKSPSFSAGAELKKAVNK